MFKRITALCLIAVIMVSFFGCGTKQAAPLSTQPVVEEKVKLWWAYATENLLKDYDYDYDRDSTLRFYAIKGETESLQLMITPKENVDSFDFIIEDIKSQSGAVISKKNFEIFVNWYVSVDRSYNSTALTGFYPDALVPLKSSKRARENFINARENQGIWVNVDIPKDAEAGVYTGTGTLKLDEDAYEIPISVTVYDAQMPEQVHSRTAFAVWYDYISKGEGSYSTELADAYFWFLIDKRVMTTNVEPGKYSDYTAYMSFLVNHLASNPDVSAYNLPYRVCQGADGHALLAEDSVLELLNMMVDKNISLRENGDMETDLFKKAYYYLGNVCDEPHTPEAFERTRICDEIISRCKLTVAERLNDYPDLKESLLGIEHVVTTALLPELIGTDSVGGVQTWCPTFENFQSQEQRERYYERRYHSERIMGEGIWWYGCIIPTAPYPTYHLDDSLVVPRVLSWMQFDYEIEGNLYWAVNYYDTCESTGRDVWESANSWPSIAGEGQLVYPGKKYGIMGPISTCRLESIREGNEDYEYFWMIDQMIQEYNLEMGTNLKTQELLRPILDGLYDGMIPERDPEAFHQHRMNLLSLLEQMCSNRNKTIESLV